MENIKNFEEILKENQEKLDELMQDLHTRKEEEARNIRIAEMRIARLKRVAALPKDSSTEHQIFSRKRMGKTQTIKALLNKNNLL